MRARFYPFDSIHMPSRLSTLLLSSLILTVPILGNDTFDACLDVQANITYEVGRSGQGDRPLQSIQVVRARFYFSTVVSDSFQSGPFTDIDRNNYSATDNKFSVDFTRTIPETSTESVTLRGRSFESLNYEGTQYLLVTPNRFGVSTEFYNTINTTGVLPFANYSISFSSFDQTGNADFKQLLRNKQPIPISTSNVFLTFRPGSSTETPYGGFLTSITPCQAHLLDPIPVSELDRNLLVNSAITADWSVLSQHGRFVDGVAADGVTQLAIRIPVPIPDRLFSVSLLSNCTSDDDPRSCTLSGSTIDNGGITRLRSSQFFSATSERSVPTTRGAMVFLIYRAPKDFVRFPVDDSKAERAVYLAINDPNGGTLYRKIVIRRPPVLLIHGLWGDKSDWDDFRDFYYDPRIFAVRLEYGEYLEPQDIQKTVPHYTESQLQQVRNSALGFHHNASRLNITARDLLRAFKATYRVASVQFDIVAHSMGGLVSRTLATLPGFVSDTDYNSGYIHKIITIGTPHLGSPLAYALLDDNNSCVRNVFAREGLHAFESVVGSFGSTSGGVGDLRGDNTGNRLSDSLTRLQQSRVPLRTAVIEGRISKAQLEGLDCFLCKLRALKIWCFRSPIVYQFNSSSYALFMGGESDGIVGSSSARNNRALASTTLLESVHSRSTTKLGFGPPNTHLLEQTTIQWVWRLLNTHVDSLEFRPIVE